ncbi:MAG: hypothetical protein OXG53_12815 [Chloroflexi bacterium]|nr:hypothetical protein [Chloroflexota bacterium]
MPNIIRHCAQAVETSALSGLANSADLFAELGLDGIEIIGDLTDLGYEGCYSLEYERRWFPDLLPPAAVGMNQCLDFLRGT